MLRDPRRRAKHWISVRFCARLSLIGIFICSALIGFAPPVDAAPWGIFVKLARLRKGMRVARATQTARVLSGLRGLSRAGAFAKTRPRMRVSQAGTLADLSEPGFKSAAAALKSMSAPGDVRRLYIGRNADGVFFASVNRGRITYGPFNKTTDTHIIKARAGTKTEVVLESAALDAGVLSEAFVKQARKISIARGDGTRWSTRRAPGDAGRLLLEYRPSLFVKIHSQSKLPDLPRLEQISLKRAKTRVLSFSGNASTNATLKELVLDHGLDFAGAVGDILDRIEEHPEDLMIVYGRVQGDNLLSYGEDGLDFDQFPIVLLDELTSDSGRPMIIVGRGAGAPVVKSERPFARTPTAKARVPDSARLDALSMRRLAAALEAQSLDEFLEALGTPENPVIVDELTVSDTLISVAARTSLTGSHHFDQPSQTLFIRITRLPPPLFRLWQLAAAFAFWVVVYGVQRWRMRRAS